MLVITTSEFDIDQNVQISIIRSPFLISCENYSRRLLPLLSDVNITDVSTVSIYMGEIFCLQQKATSYLMHSTPLCNQKQKIAWFKWDTFCWTVSAPSRLVLPRETCCTVLPPFQQASHAEGEQASLGLGHQPFPTQLELTVFVRVSMGCTEISVCCDAKLTFDDIECDK